MLCFDNDHSTPSPPLTSRSSPLTSPSLSFHSSLVTLRPSLVPPQTPPLTSPSLTLQQNSQITAVSTGTKLKWGFNVLLLPELLTGSGRTSFGSAFISLTTSSISMMSWSSSIISLGGRLGPLHVSLSHRHTVACKK